MDRDELILREYKLYADQKENFIDRNFHTNKFYMIAVFATLLGMIFTGNIIFLGKISATLIFAFMGISVSSLWWMNVDSYNTLIKIKYSTVIEKIEEKLPVKPFTEEYKGIDEFKNNKVFMFSDIQKLIAAIMAIFFFAVFISELAPVVVKLFDKVLTAVIKVKGGI